MVTTETEKQCIVRAVGLGAKGYLVKPIADKENALARVAHALGT